MGTPIQFQMNSGRKLICSLNRCRIGCHETLQRISRAPHRSTCLVFNWISRKSWIHLMGRTDEGVKRPVTRRSRLQIVRCARCGVSSHRCRIRFLLQTEIFHSLASQGWTIEKDFPQRNNKFQFNFKNIAEGVSRNTAPRHRAHRAEIHAWVLTE